MMETSLTSAGLYHIAIGVGGSLIVYLVVKARGALHVPSCVDNEKKAIQPIKKMGNDSTITLWGFQPQGHYPSYVRGIADGSPYVARVENYLRMLKLPYTKCVSLDLSENPRQKLPFANIYGAMVDDSTKIIDEIERCFIDQQKGDDCPYERIDLNGSNDQSIQAHLITRLLFGSLYWVRYYMNFATEAGRQDVTDELKKEIPFPIHWFVSALVIKTQYANLFGQGIARMPMEDVIRMGRADLRTLNAIIANSSTGFVLGTKKPTLIDIDVYSFVSHLLYDTTPSAMDWVMASRDEFPELVQYIGRMKDLLYPELLNGGDTKIKTN